MDAQDVAERDAVLRYEVLAAWVDPDPVLRDDGRVAQDLLVVLRAQRAQFAPRSSHPVAMMLDEWIARLEQYAACPLLPLPG